MNVCTPAPIIPENLTMGFSPAGIAGSSTPLTISKYKDIFAVLFMVARIGNKLYTH